MNHWDVLLLGIRWLHLLAATVWIGGSLFYLLILGPVLKNPQHQDRHGQGLIKAISVKFKHTVDICLWILVVSGSVILIDRATGNYLTTVYITAISIKLLLVSILVSIILTKRRLKFSQSSLAQESSLFKRLSYRIVQWKTIAYLGVVILFITEILRFAVEQALSN